MSAPGGEAQAWLVQARHWAQAGDAQAERAYARVLEHAPACVEARVGLARLALARGAAAAALGHLQQACLSEPGNPQLLKSLAVAAEAAGYPEEARQALEYALKLAPNLYPAQLQLGRLLEQHGDTHGATRAYFRAVSRAQFDGQWLDAQSTPERLRGEVLHAIEFVQRGRVEILAGLMEPLQARFGRDAMGRVERCLMGYLAVDPVLPADARQRPKFLYFPELPSGPYFDNADFDWIERLEQSYEDIRAEARAAIAEQAALTPFLEFGAGDSVEDYLQGGDAPPRWDALFFYRHGRPYPDNQQRCPLTARLLDSLPLMRIAEHAPEVCFSVLSPGTHILPHHGVTNVRAVVHLPLLVPDDCALQVGGEVHAWRAGRCVAFDDTYLHEAWNRSGQTRVILLMDAWNPHLTQPERHAVAELIEGIGQFNRG